jgi:NAD+ synthase (glutamine-hydrolysing)
MRLAKLAVASVSPTVGAVRSNVNRLIAVAREMSDANVTIGAFPEQAIGGYPPEDLVQWPGFLIGQRLELERFAKETKNAKTVFVIGLAVSAGGQIFNAAAVVHRGRIAGLVPKEKLPTYNAPPLLFGLGDHRQRLDLAVSHGRGFHAPRDAGDARRG